MSMIEFVYLHILFVFEADSKNVLYIEFNHLNNNLYLPILEPHKMYSGVFLNEKEAIVLPTKE